MLCKVKINIKIGQKAAFFIYLYSKNCHNCSNIDTKSKFCAKYYCVVLNFYNFANCSRACTCERDDFGLGFITWGGYYIPNSDG